MRKVKFYCDVCGKDIEDANILDPRHKMLFCEKNEEKYFDLCPECFTEILFQISKLKKKNGMEESKNAY